MHYSTNFEFISHKINVQGNVMIVCVTFNNNSYLNTLLAILHKFCLCNNYSFIVIDKYDIGKVYSSSEGRSS